MAQRDADLVITGIDSKPDWVLFELGCGVGRIINELRGRQVPFQRFIGVDIAEKMIEFAGKYLGEDARIELKVNNGYDLSVVEDNCVDFGYSVDVFIHIFDFDLAANYLKEVKRMLKNGGTFRFNVRRADLDKMFSNSVGGMVAKWSYKLGLRSMGEHRWQIGEEAEFNGNHYGRRELHSLVAESGLQIIEVKDVESMTWCTVRKLA